MIIYLDILQNNEQISKAYVVEETDLFLKCKGSLIMPDVEDGTEDVAKVIDISYKQGLEEAQMDKTTFSMALKNMMKAIAKRKTAAGVSKDDLKAWQVKASEWANTFLKEFDDWTFYVHSSVEDYTSCYFSLCKWEGETPYFYFFKDALKEMKV